MSWYYQIEIVAPDDLQLDGTPYIARIRQTGEGAAVRCYRDLCKFFPDTYRIRLSKHSVMEHSRNLAGNLSAQEYEAHWDRHGSTAYAERAAEMRSGHLAVLNAGISVVVEWLHNSLSLTWPKSKPVTIPQVEKKKKKKSASQRIAAR